METVSLVLSLALPLFIVIDPFGLVGIVTSLIKNFPPKKQRRILHREVLIALLIMLIFFGFGSVFLEALDISQATVLMTGGIIFLGFALGLLFPSSDAAITDNQEEPFLVPIATPLMAGPSTLAMIILDSQNEAYSPGILLGGIVTAWLASTLVILMAPRLSMLLGNTGVKVLEQIMGLVCLMIAVGMILDGLIAFSDSF